MRAPVAPTPEVPAVASKIPALPPTPPSITDRTPPADADDAGPTEVMHDAALPFSRAAHDTIDPLGATQPVESLVASMGIDPRATPLMFEPVATVAAPPPPAPKAATPEPPALAPPPTIASPVARPPVARPETARTGALVSSRPAATRAPRELRPRDAELRMKRVGIGAAALLALTPWLAPLQLSARVPALGAAMVALAAGVAPLPVGARTVLSVGFGSVLLGALLVATTDLPALGLGLTGALLLVLPGALFHRRDEPDSRAGRGLAAFGLALGLAWLLAPGAGGALGLAFPPSGARDFATVSLVPWLLLGVLSLPRATAAVGGSLFAAGLILWSAVLGMLRSDAIAMAHVDRWRVVASHGVCVAATAAVVAAGAALAIGAGDED